MATKIKVPGCVGIPEVTPLNQLMKPIDIPKSPRAKDKGNSIEARLKSRK